MGPEVTPLEIYTFTWASAGLCRAEQEQSGINRAFREHVFRNTTYHHTYQGGNGNQNLSSVELVKLY